MASATTYGNPEKMTVVKKRMDDRYIESIVQTICMTVAVMFTIGAVLTPFVYYVVKIVPAQHEQQYNLRIECLAHHTVEACMRLTAGGNPIDE